MAAKKRHVSYIKLEKERKRKRDKVKKGLLFGMRHLIPAIAVILTLVPILAIVIASFKSHDAFQSSGSFEFTGGFTFNNYKEALIDGNLLRGFVNTLFISVVSIILTIFIGSMTAYVLTRFKFIGSKLIKMMFLIASFVPSITMQVSIFQIIKKLGIYNTYWAAILIYVGTDLVSVYIFMQYLQEIPKAIDEAAIMDGASRFTIYRKLILPLLRPATVSVIILKGITFYNDFFTAFLYMPTNDHAVISTALKKFSALFGGRWEVLAAGIVITMLPTLIAFIVFRKQIYKGVAQNTNKG